MTVKRINNTYNQALLHYATQSAIFIIYLLLSVLITRLKSCFFWLFFYVENEVMSLWLLNRQLTSNIVPRPGQSRSFAV